MRRSGPRRVLAEALFRRGFGKSPPVSSWPALRALQRSDGGFATTEAGEPEVEPAAIAALGLRDDASRAWLVRRQRPDGGFRAPSGRTESTDGALAALALGGAAARRSLRYAVARRGLPLPGAADQTRRGWGWTAEARSFVEPTCGADRGERVPVTPDDRRVCVRGGASSRSVSA